MKRFGILILVAGVFLAACGSGNPDIVMDRTELSLGEVINGEIRTFEVSIQNQGTAELVIEEVTTSCGCTKAEIQPSIIAPNETGILRVRFDSGAHGPELKGTVVRQIFIASNDPDEPEVEFQFSAEILSSEP